MMAKKITQSAETNNGLMVAINNGTIIINNADDIKKVIEQFAENYYPKLRDALLNDFAEKYFVECSSISDLRIPSIRVLANVINNVAFCEEGSIRSLYAKLLAAASDKNKNVEYSFVEIINQLSSGDVNLIEHMKEYFDDYSYLCCVTVKFTNKDGTMKTRFPKYFCPMFDDMTDYDSLSISIENLHRLGLIDIVEGSFKSVNYDSIEKSKAIQDAYQKAKSGHKHPIDLDIEMKRYVISFSDFGRRFILLCYNIPIDRW